MNDDQLELDRLIDTARAHDHPSPETTERAWTSLHAALTVGAPHAAPVATSMAAVNGSWTKLVLAAVTLASALTTALVAATVAREPESGLVRANAAGTAIDGGSHGRSTDGPEPAVFERAALPPPPSPVIASSRSRRRPAPETTTPPGHDAVAASTLAQQARMLGEAWRLINAGAAPRALELLDAHAERFPDSPLARERRAATLVAHCAQQRPDARAQARRFVRDDPAGTLAARVASACGEGR